MKEHLAYNARIEAGGAFIVEEMLMMTLKGKIAFVTGGPSGIGRACASTLAELGADVLLCARRKDRLADLAKDLSSRFGVRTRPLELDVRDGKAVENAVGGLPEDWRAIDILVNNAGLARGMEKLYEGRIQDWEEMLDTNVKGLLYVTRAVVPGMLERGRGHVVNIGSIAGREVYPGGNVYCASKFAEKALTRGLKIDLLGSPIRVTTVDPGLVETEFSQVRFHGDKERAAKVYKNLEPLKGEDIADAVAWAVTRPAHVNISEMVVLPTAQSSATLVHRGVLGARS